MILENLGIPHIAAERADRAEHRAARLLLVPLGKIGGAESGAGQPMASGFVILVVDGPDGAQRIIGPPAPGLAAPPLTIDQQFAERED